MRMLKIAYELAPALICFNMKQQPTYWYEVRGLRTEYMNLVASLRLRGLCKIASRAGWQQTSFNYRESRGLLGPTSSRCPQRPQDGLPTGKVPKQTGVELNEHVTYLFESIYMSSELNVQVRLY